jgi:hypothetical protein
MSRYATTRTFWLVQSRHSVRAACHRRYRAPPAPMTAGMPSSPGPYLQNDLVEATRPCHFSLRQQAGRKLPEPPIQRAHQCAPELRPIDLHVVVHRAAKERRGIVVVPAAETVDLSFVYGSSWLGRRVRHTCSGFPFIRAKVEDLRCADRTAPVAASQQVEMGAYYASAGLVSRCRFR